MDKVEKLLKMQKILDLISSKMDRLEEDLNRVTTCVQEKRLISVEISRRVMSGLLEVNNLNEECKKLYDEVEINKEMSDRIETIEKVVFHSIKKAEILERKSRQKSKRKKPRNNEKQSKQCIKLLPNIFSNKG